MSAPVPLPSAGAEVIRLGFERYREEFREITRRARRRFEQRDWAGGQQDAAERLEIRRRFLREALSELRRVLGERFEDRRVWGALRVEYGAAVHGRPDVELAETFFNSLTRLVFTTVGVDPQVEFVGLEFERARYPTWSTIHKSYVRAGSVRALVREILADCAFEAPWRDLDSDAALAGERIERAWHEATRGRPLESAAMIDAVFFRGCAAYLVGRLRGSIAACPLVLVLVNGPLGIELDAVLLTESEVSIVFSFTRSYFHVDLECPSQAVRFLRLLMPRKPVADLYISLGHNKHGKTELYRSLLAHLARSTERFDFAPGDVGMVMIVFAMPTHAYVFKVIRDRFAYPKTSTRQDVLDCYELVFTHDRAGRLVDAQEFEHLTFDRERFTPSLVDELARKAAGSVTITERAVTLHHLYIERRVRPLNLFLREAERNTANGALLDYGQALRDLASANIFPGDLLLKNFGVTRHGRVIFYDYDELCRVTDCSFRDLPAAASGDEEMAAEPWFYVGEDDVFPEEFIRFLGLTPEQRAVFLAEHAEVLTAAWWRALQERHRAGEVLDIFPYPPARRLRPERPPPA